MTKIVGDKNPINKDGTTTLHCAAIHGDTKIIQLLLTYGGCSVTHRDNRGCLNVLVNNVKMARWAAVVSDKMRLNPIMLMMMVVQQQKALS